MLRKMTSIDINVGLKLLLSLTALSDWVWLADVNSSQHWPHNGADHWPVWSTCWTPEGKEQPHLVARMMISVLVGVTRTSTPEYPSSASSRVRNSFSSALKMPSETNWRQESINWLTAGSCRTLVIKQSNRWSWSDIYPLSIDIVATRFLHIFHDRLFAPLRWLTKTSPPPPPRPHWFQTSCCWSSPTVSRY